MKAGSVFSGVGGLDLAVADAFGTEPAWFCDNDPAAARVLDRHWPGVPVFGDITTVDWGQVEPVELLTAGWPCQPWSVAGQRKGIEDERALWPEVARALRVLRPQYAVLENVPRIVTAGELARACTDLAAQRYRFAWTVLGADEIGAPHRRHRCFVVAVADTNRIGPERNRTARQRRPGSAHGGSSAADPGCDARSQDDADRAAPGRCGGAVADSACDGRHEGWPEPAGQFGGSDVAVGGGASPADPASARRPRHVAGAAVSQDSADADRAGQVQPGGLDRPVADGDRRGAIDWGIYTAAVRRWEHILGRPAPVPRIAGPRGGLKLNPALPEWMQGFAAGWITDTPGVSVNDALRLAGNSVNPYQAVAALRWLLSQLDAERAA